MRRKITRLYRAWWNRNLGTCKETVRLVSESHDRKLVAREWARLRLHVMFCSFCRRYERQLEHISGMVAVARILVEGSGFALSVSLRVRMKTSPRKP